MTARVLTSSAILVLSMGGCSWGGQTVEETNDAPIPSGSHDDCGETPPVVHDVRIEDGGIREFEAGTFLPSIVITADVTDEDGDLTYYTMQLWWDREVDDYVEPDGLPSETFATLSDTECSVDDVTVAMILGIGGGLPYSTELEFGVRIKDDLDHHSNDGELVTTVFVTPDSEGNYPD